MVSSSQHCSNVRLTGIAIVEHADATDLEIIGFKSGACGASS
jgi:hypothetical protein